MWQDENIIKRRINNLDSSPLIDGNLRRSSKKTTLLNTRTLRKQVTRNTKYRLNVINLNLLNFTSANLQRAVETLLRTYLGKTIVRKRNQTILEKFKFHQ